MLTTFVRVIILYILVLVVMRLMGKREIGQLQPFELAIAIMIADLAAVPMGDTGIPITNGIIPILALLLLHVLISIINLKSIHLRGFISGKPTILIYRGKINEKALKKERFTINELQERLRNNNIVNIGDVEYAILETSGQITVIQKPEKRGTIPKDFNILPEYEGLPYDLVIDGKIMKDNLKAIGKDYNWLKKEVKKFGIMPEEALVVTIDGGQQIFCQKKEGTYGAKVMIREFVTIIAILCIIVVGHVTIQNYLVDSSEKVISKIEETKKNISEDKLDIAKENMQEIEEEWETIHKTWSIVVMHSELDQIELSLVSAKRALEDKNMNDVNIELERLGFLLKHIQEKEAFKLKNIF